MLALSLLAFHSCLLNICKFDTSYTAARDFGYKKRASEKPMLLKVASCYKVFLGFRPVYIVAQIERTKRTNYFFFAFSLPNWVWYKKYYYESLNGRCLIILNHFAWYHLCSTPNLQGACFIPAPWKKVYGERKQKIRSKNDRRCEKQPTRKQ